MFPINPCWKALHSWSVGEVRDRCVQRSVLHMHGFYNTFYSGWYMAPACLIRSVRPVLRSDKDLHRMSPVLVPIVDHGKC